MTPTEVGPAIARLLMLASSAQSEADVEHFRGAFAPFEDDPDALRTLLGELAAQANARLPEGAFVALDDAADLVAFAIVQHGNHAGCVRNAVASLPEAHLEDVAAALLGLYRTACEYTAAAELAGLRIPDHVPSTEDR